MEINELAIKILEENLIQQKYRLKKVEEFGNKITNLEQAKTTFKNINSLKKWIIEIEHSIQILKQNP